MKQSIVLAALFVVGLAQAALPQYPDRVRHLDAILKEKRVEIAVTDPRFTGKSSKVIDGIQLRGQSQAGSQYEVTTGKCKLDVTLKVVAETVNGQLVVGPGKIVLSVGRSLRCP